MINNITSLVQGLPCFSPKVKEENGRMDGIFHRIKYMKLEFKQLQYVIILSVNADYIKMVILDILLRCMFSATLVYQKSS